MTRGCKDQRWHKRRLREIVKWKWHRRIDLLEIEDEDIEIEDEDGETRAAPLQG